MQKNKIILKGGLLIFGMVLLAGCAEMPATNNGTTSKEKAIKTETTRNNQVDNSKLSNNTWELANLNKEKQTENQRNKNTQKSSEKKSADENNFNNKSTDKMNNKENSNIDMELAKTCQLVTLDTTMGKIKIKLYGDKAPMTVANFCTLAKKGFYDGIKFHRVIDGFMIQAGDPKSKDDSLKAEWGTGGPGYKFKDELPQPGEYKLGSVAMANSGPNTNGSQFFIVSGQAGINLPPSYSLFGEVVEGMDVVEKIQKVATEEKGIKDRPIEDVVIKSAVPEIEEEKVKDFKRNP